MFEDKITFPVNLTFTKAGKKKTGKGVFPTNWPTLTESVIDDNIKYKAVLTGKKNNIICVDFDEPKDGELDGMDFYYKNIEFFNKTFCEKSVSGKGIHAYFKYNPLVKSINRINGINGLSIDVLSDKKCAIIGEPINNNPIIEMSDNLIDLLIGNITKDSQQVEEQIEEQVEEQVKEKVEFEDIEKVKSLVNILTKKESDNRKIWIDIGLSLFNILEDKKEAFNIWDKFSRLSKKYNASDITEQWNSFKSSNKTIASIIHYCKEYKIKFNKWKSESKIKKNINLKEIIDKYNLNDNYFNLIFNLYTDLSIAEWFINEYKNQFIYYDNKLFHYNGKYWERHNNTTTIYNIISRLTNKLQPIYNDIDNMLRNNDEAIDDSFVSRIDKISKTFKKLSFNTNIVSAEKFIINRITINKDKLFDLNTNLICFTNGTYDLDLDIFKDNNPLDYITICTHYDYIKSNEEDKEFVFNYLNKVISDPEKLQVLLLTLASGLRGVTLEKFIILTGAGRNSKDTLITYIMKAVLGNYYYLGNTASITNIIKEGVNVGLANLEDKRFAVYNEPAKDHTIKISTVKYLTGTNSINTRGLYSSKTDISICPTMFLLCNDIPKLDAVDDAIKERLVIIHFDSLFREADYFVENEIKEGENNIYLCDDNVKSPEFLNKMKVPFMNVLLDYYKIFKSNGYKLGTMPDCIKKETNKYMVTSDKFTSWLNSNYKKSINKDDFIELKEVYKNYKYSDLYDNLTKQEKQYNNYENFKDKIIKNPNLRPFYLERKKINKKDYRHILINYIVNDDNDDDDDNDNLQFS
jgi:phage/plasmid-associated DNA primase